MKVKMKFCFAFLPLALYFIPACLSQNSTELVRNDLSGKISESYIYTVFRWWSIKVPENMYVRIKISTLNLTDYTGCSRTYLKIMTTNKTYKYCSTDNSEIINPITASSDVNITFSHTYIEGPTKKSSFSLSYHTEDLLCVQENHFRCSNHSCIQDTQVCNGVKDCDNGLDEVGCEKEILPVRGLNESRVNAISWLLKNRQSFGWGKNTHRAVTALYLGRGASFDGQNLVEELITKQLELQTSVALLRNSTVPLSVGELSMFVNGLSATCHNPRRFYGYDLVKVLGERASTAASPSPGAYLTLCNSNWTLSVSQINSLLHLLRKNSKYPFVSDVQAVTVMALTCVKNLQGKEFARAYNASYIYNATVEKFSQHSDGSFGNVYTTALVTQALIASGQEDNSEWNSTSTVRYLMAQLNSTSVDFLSTYLTLPIFAGRSLVDMAHVNCSNISRKQDENNEISDITDKLGGKVSIQYSLFVGDQKDVIHTIFLRLPARSTAYDIMRVAQVADPKYKFRHGFVSGHMYVYEIAGIVNDPEQGKFWLMYSEDRNRTMKHHTESPDKFIVGDNGHLIMWYKTAHI